MSPYRVAPLCSSAFDAVGNRTRLEYPSGRKLDYEYDNLNRLLRIKEESTGNKLVEWAYDGPDRIATRKYFKDAAGNPLINTTTWTYTNGGDLSSLISRDTANNIVVGYEQHITKGGGKTWQLVRHDPAKSHVYQEDALYRLTGWKQGLPDVADPSDIPSPAKVFAWALDLLGNWTTVDRSEPPPALSTETRTHNNKNEVTQIVKDGVTWTLTFDANGNTTSRNRSDQLGVEYAFEYDEENRLLLSSDTWTDTWLDGGHTHTYTVTNRQWHHYDALGRRVLVSLEGEYAYYDEPNTFYYVGGGFYQQWRFAYDGSRSLEVMTATASDELGQQFTNLGHAFTHVWGLYPDEMVQFDHGLNRVFALHDPLYSVTGAVLEDGGKHWTRSFSLFAETSEYTYHQQLPQGAYARTRHGFTGQFHDNWSGLYHFKARAYDPVLGRFLQRDPAGFVDGSNLYEYVRSAPHRYTDPTGRAAAVPPATAEPIESLNIGTVVARVEELRQAIESDGAAFDRELRQLASIRPYEEAVRLEKAGDANRPSALYQKLRIRHDRILMRRCVMLMLLVERPDAHAEFEDGRTLEEYMRCATAVLDMSEIDAFMLDWCEQHKNPTRIEPPSDEAPESVAGNLAGFLPLAGFVEGITSKKLGFWERAFAIGSEAGVVVKWFRKGVGLFKAIRSSRATTINGKLVTRAENVRDAQRAFVADSRYHRQQIATNPKADVVMHSGPVDVKKCDGIFCFLAGTAVTTADAAVAIEALRVGQRVLTPGTVLDAADGRPSDQWTGRWYAVRVSLSTAVSAFDVADITLLKSEADVVAGGFRAGAWVPVHVPELAMAGRAHVESVTPAIVVEGPGRVVTMTVNHFNNDVHDLRTKGDGDVLGTTGLHPFYSDTSRGWRRAFELVIDERLRTMGGSAAMQDRIPRPGLHRVYNIEVAEEHCYYVGSQRLLSHNAGPGKGGVPCNKAGAAASVVHVKAGEVTTFADFVKRSKVGDNLEGHEIWQHANLKAKGLAGERLSTEASKKNPVIAMDRATHQKVNAAQQQIDASGQSPIQNIEANAALLRKLGAADEAAIRKLEEAAKSHAKSLGY